MSLFMPEPGEQFVRLGWVYSVVAAHAGHVTFNTRCGRQWAGGARRVSLDEWRNVAAGSEPLLEVTMRERNLTEEQARRWLKRSE